MNILLVEDELELANALSTILQKSGYTVTVANDGGEAEQELNNSEYDGVILDLMLPVVDGLTVLRGMRSRGNKTPVIILTAKSDIDDRVEGLDAGADDYLAKPFSAKELLARLRAITRRSSDATAEENMSFGNITLNTSNFRLSGPNGEVTLANKEFRMLSLLMIKPDKLISVEAFMEKIWGEDTETEQNVVWVYITYLRRKLEAIGSNAVIRAHRNAGYSLEII
jgi:DNA-binding response OmpR family regulator